MMEAKKESPATTRTVRDSNTLKYPLCDSHKDMEVFPNEQIFTESFEAEKLQRLIENKKEFLKKLKNDFARRKLQEEILFLENTILPIVLTETTLLFNEANRYVNEKMRKAIDMKCDAMLCLIPLRNDIPKDYLIGVANPKELTVFGRLDEFDIAIEQMRPGMKINVVNLPL
jgi:hypothetical protein